MISDRLVDFEDASGFHDWGSFLSLGKPFRAFSIDVYPRKLFAVMIENGHLPVLMFAPPIALHAGRGRFCLFFLHDVQVLNFTATIASLIIRRKYQLEG